MDSSVDPGLSPGDFDDLAERVRADFGLPVRALTLAKGGLDTTATVLRGDLADGSAVAVKLGQRHDPGRLLAWRHFARTFPDAVPGPIPTLAGAPAGMWRGLRLTVVPWVEGTRGVDGAMGPQQWRDLGVLLRAIHGTALPAGLAEQVPREDYRSGGHDRARRFHTRLCGPGAPQSLTSDPAAAVAVRLWREAADTVSWLLEAVDDLGSALRAAPAPAVPCHADFHSANLVVAADGTVHVLDWDELVLAPPERDLMFVIGGVIAPSPVVGEATSAFFAGYGDALVDPVRLAYYRCSWALQDLAGFAECLLDRAGAGDRTRFLDLFRSLFSPTGIVSLAVESLAELSAPVTPPGDQMRVAFPHDHLRGERSRVFPSVRAGRTAD